MTWHNLTPRGQVLAMLEAEMDRLDAAFGPVRPFTDEHPLAVADDLTEAAYLLRDVQACAEYDRTRWEVPK